MASASPRCPEDAQLTCLFLCVCLSICVSPWWEVLSSLSSGRVFSGPYLLSVYLPFSVPALVSLQDPPVDMGGALGPALLLTSLLGAWAGPGPGQREQAVTVAVVFGSSGPLQAQVPTRLTPQNFLDLPLAIQPLTVGVNNTNPSSILTQICGLLGAARVHGIVFEDNVDTEAVAQLLDFVSSQTHVPILSISGGSAVVLSPKVPV